MLDWYLLPASAVANARLVLADTACYEESLKLDPTPDLVPAWYNLGIEGGGTVGRTAYSKKACCEQALKHKTDLAPAWYSLGFEGGGTVDRTAYSKKACYEPALKHSSTTQALVRRIGSSRQVQGAKSTGFDAKDLKTAGYSARI